MYLLIFEAWATLMGFTLNEPMTWNDFELRLNYIKEGEEINESINDFATLVHVNPIHLAVDFDGGIIDNTVANQAGNALMLANIMTHVSMILIFVFFVCFIIWLFRLFGHMLSRR